MYTYKLAQSLTLAAFVAVTASMTISFADSSASLQAGSSSSTMNNAQAARETSSQSSTLNNSQSSNQQGSQASTQNNTNGSSEAVGGPLNSNNPAPVNVPPTSNGRPRTVTTNSSVTNSSVTNSRTTNSGTTNSKVKVSSSVPLSHTAKTVTHSYKWRPGRGHKRSYSNAYMTRTIRQAAVTPANR